MRDEQELILAAAAGDRRAFDELVEFKRERVVRIAYQVTGNLDDALDVAQGVFLKLWQGLGSYDPGRRFDTWLHRITVNAAIDHLRSRGPKGVLQPLPDETARTLADDSPGADSTVDRRRLQAAFTRLAARLAPKQRAVFVLKEIEGLETAEVARVLGVAESTVRNHLLQARRTLREGLRREYPALLDGIDERRADGEGEDGR